MDWTKVLTPGSNQTEMYIVAEEGSNAFLESMLWEKKNLLQFVL